MPGNPLAKPAIIPTPERYLDVKWAEVQTLRVTTHPVEFQMYYSL